MTTLSGSSTREPSRRRPIEHVAHGVLELADLDDAVGLGHADHGRELADPLGREAAPAQARDRRHPRVVPAPDVALVDESQQHALRQHGVGEVETGELVLVRGATGPAGARSASRRAAGGPRTRACRSNASRPRSRRTGRARSRTSGRCTRRRRCAGALRGDPVEDRVAQVDVRRGHVDPGAQDPRPVRELAAPHARRTGRGSRRPTDPGTACRGRAR